MFSQVTWTLAVLAIVFGGNACRSADPGALFAEAEELRLAYKKEASERAILKYQEARDVWRRSGKRARAATASRMLGATYEQLGLLEAALESYLEAASLCQESCEPLLESAISSDIGITRAMLGDSEAARTECERALNLARDAGGLREEAEALNCAGEVEYLHGDLPAALERYRQAMILWERAADPRGEAETLFNEGSALTDLSQFDEARANLERASDLWSASGDKRGAAMAIYALGRHAHLQGQYQVALNHFTHAGERLKEVGDRFWEGMALGSVGNVYRYLGDGARALPYLEQSLERSEKTGVHAATWDLLIQVGRAYMALEDPAQALQRFGEALTLSEKTKSHRWRAYSLQQMSQAHQSLGEPDEALQCLERALELQQSARDPRLEAAIHAEMGNTFELLGDHPRAAESFGSALKLSRASSDRVGESTALFGMARVARARGHLDAARDYLENSLRVAESLRTDVESREMRTSYFASIYRLHELYIDVLMSLHKARPRDGLAAAAFETSERGRARSLLESLTEARVDVRAGVDPGLLENEADLKQRLKERSERRARLKSETEEAKALDREIRALEEQRDLRQAEIRSKSPRYAALTRPEPLHLEEVQKQLLDEDTLLLEYSLGEERSFLWAVSNHEFASFELSPRADIEGQAVRIYELLTARARVDGESLSERNRRLEKADDEYWEAAARLSRTLLGPVAERIRGKKIVVVADGALQYLPFGALTLPGSKTDDHPLIADHEIVNLPSASSLAVLRQETRGREPPERTVAVFADPVFTEEDPRLNETFHSGKHDSGISPALANIGFLRSGDLGIPRLEATREEASAILELAPLGTKFEGFHATRLAAMEPELGQYRILHFATHGLSNSDHPAMSGILLSMFDDRGQPLDGFLRVHDIYDLRLNADLVVLSACNTALGKQVRGEGLVGIARAFLYAGAKRVVATLWKVDDEATRELMSRFYREMFEKRRSPSAALRNAQLQMLHETEWRSPFFWAAFALQGEWRTN